MTYSAPTVRPREGLPVESFQELRRRCLLRATTPPETTYPLLPYCPSESKLDRCLVMHALDLANPLDHERHQGCDRSILWHPPSYQLDEKGRQVRDRCMP